MEKRYIALWLPLPPSLNRIWRVGRARSGVPRVYRAKKYMDWIKLADCDIMEQFATNGRPETIKGPYELQLVLKKPDSRRRDLGNLEKVISDYIVRVELVEDDKFCQHIDARWADASYQMASGCALVVRSVKL